MRIRSSPLALLTVTALLCPLPAGASQATDVTELGTDTCLECHDSGA